MALVQKSSFLCVRKSWVSSALVRQKRRKLMFSSSLWSVCSVFKRKDSSVCLVLNVKNRRYGCGDMFLNSHELNPHEYSEI